MRFIENISFKKSIKNSIITCSEYANGIDSFSLNVSPWKI